MKKFNEAVSPELLDKMVAVARVIGDPEHLPEIRNRKWKTAGKVNPGN